MEVRRLRARGHPQTFGEIYGQEAPKKMLSRLIQEGQIGRSLLLHGSIGSGKTSLAWLYGAALNCEQPALDGSPCGACRVCFEPDPEQAGFHEYDVSGEGGRFDQIQKWLKPRRSRPTGLKHRIIFFDEAHNMADSAQDSLLKSVENGPLEHTRYLFATTEPNRLRPALRSRLLHVEVRPLSIPEAIRFLRDVAQEQGISCSNEALTLIAGLHSGLPRNLRRGLEEAKLGDKGHVEVDWVRTIFDVDHADTLVEYFQALGDGDDIQQTKLFFEWREPIIEKIRWIKSFLSEIYFNNLLVRSVLIDPLTNSIAFDQRKEIVDTFCARFGATDARHILPHWQEMMRFWVSPLHTSSEAAAHLQIALFHQFVNHDLPEIRLPQRKETKLVEPPRLPTYQLSETLTGYDVVEVFNKSSYLIQEYGAYFNACFELRPARFGIGRDDKLACDLIQAFDTDLEAQATRDFAETFARITLRARDELGQFGLVIAHMPALLRDKTGKAGVRMEDWLSCWKRERRTADGAITWTFSTRNIDRQALKFHWESVKKLCAGWENDDEEDSLNLRDELGLPRRKSMVFRHPPLVNFSTALQNESIADRCKYGMEPLYPIRDGAFNWVYRNWEQKEHQERQRLKEKFREELDSIHLLHSPTSEAAAIAEESLSKRWCFSPKERPRGWSGWW